MTFRSAVAISSDVTMTGPMPHSTLLGVSAPTPAAEVPVPMFWPPGFVQNKLTSSVFHRGLPICQHRHDCGWGISHVHGPPDPLDALHTSNSSRKAVFGASTVRVQSVGVAAAGSPNYSFTPMLACGNPVPLPQPGCTTLMSNTMTFGMSVGDYVAGWTDTTIEMLLAGAASGLASAITKNPVLQEIVAPQVKHLFNQVTGFAEGLVTMVAADGPASIGLGYKSPVLEALAEGSNKLLRDESGKYQWEWYFRGGGHTVGFRVDFDEGDITGISSETETTEEGDVIVERDGKRIRYHNDPENLAEHGRVSVEES